MSPKISAILTVYDRPKETLARVFDSLHTQAYDELVIVLDGTPEPLRKWIRGYGLGSRAVYTDIVRPPGWLCPARAWNEGFRAATGDLFYCFSSEVIQADGNVARAAQILDSYSGHAVVYGACVDDGPVGLVQSSRPNVLCDSQMARPLGFIWAAMAETVHTAGGFDEGFMAGHWYDDDDISIRLWRACQRFVFDDSVCGTHQHHERAELSQESIRRNRLYFESKYPGLERPHIRPHCEIRTAGRTVWE